MRLFIVGLIVTVTLFFSCNRPDAREAKEPVASNDSVLQLPESKLVIPINLRVSDLEKLINEKVKGKIIDQAIRINEKEDSLFLQISKIKPIKMYWNTPKVTWIFPMDVSGKFKTRIAGVKVKNSVPVEAELVVKIETEIHIDSDWTLATQSSLLGITWVKDPRLKVTFLNINIKKPIEKIIFKNESIITERLDNTLRNTIDTRGMFENLWINIQKPVRINKLRSEVYLKGYAKSLHARWINTGKEFISMEAELNTFIQTLMENEDVPASNNQLPVFTRKENSIDSIQAFILARIPFTVLNNILQREIAGKKIEASGFSTTISQIQVRGISQGLGLKLSLKDDFDGEIEGIGQIGHISDSSLIFIKEFNYELDTDNMLAQTADWMSKPYINDWFSSKLKWYYADYAEALPALIENGMNKSKLGSKLQVSVSNLKVEPQKILVTKGDIQILFQAAGKAVIDLDEEVFKRQQK